MFHVYALRFVQTIATLIPKLQKLTVSDNPVIIDAVKTLRPGDKGQQIWHRMHFAALKDPVTNHTVLSVAETDITGKRMPMLAFHLTARDFHQRPPCSCHDSFDRLEVGPQRRAGTRKTQSRILCRYCPSAARAFTRRGQCFEPHLPTSKHTD